MIINLISLFFTFFLLQSCGMNPAPSEPIELKKNAKKEPVHLDLDANIDGQYSAIFETVNPELTNKITGAFTLSRDKSEDELIGDVRLTNAGAKIIHAQNVRLGRRCPNESDDTNQDGIIDAKEGESVYGKILFPLDGDLSTQTSHDGEFPVGDLYGNYIYSRVAKFTHFIQDLRSQEQTDGQFKLKKRQPLKIEGRVVVIHGINESTVLPNTVESSGHLPIHHALPIACGIIHKVNTVPGEIDNGTYAEEINERF